MMFVVLFLNGNSNWRAGDWFDTLREAKASIDSLPPEFERSHYKIVMVPATLVGSRDTLR